MDPASNGQSEKQKHEPGMTFPQSQLERHQENLFIVNFEKISYQTWRTEMMVRDLRMQILLIKTAQSMSANMYYVFFTKLLQGGDTTSEIVFHKRHSRICG